MSRESNGKIRDQVRAVPHRMLRPARQRLYALDDVEVEQVCRQSTIGVRAPSLSEGLDERLGEGAMSVVFFLLERKLLRLGRRIGDDAGSGGGEVVYELIHVRPGLRSRRFRAGDQGGAGMARIDHQNF